MSVAGTRRARPVAAVAPVHAPARLALSTIGAVVLVVLARRAARGTVSAREEQVFRVINGLTPALRGPAWLVMQAGSLPAVGVSAVAALPRSRSTAVALAVDGTAVWALCKAVKRIVRRGRPADHLDEVVICGKAQRGAGFPSGHAAVATTLVVVASRIVPRPAKPLAWGVAAVVCGARQYVGAHLPLDVAGGAVLGLSAGAVTNLALDVVAAGRP